MDVLHTASLVGFVLVRVCHPYLSFRPQDNLSCGQHEAARSAMVRLEHKFWKWQMARSRLSRSLTRAVKFGRV